MLTYRTALAVIRYRDLDPNDCSFCVYRNFQIPTDDAVLFEQHVIDVKYTWSKTYITRTGLGIRQRFKIAYVDRFLLKAARRQKFEVYLPQTLNALANLAVSHPNCVRYHILEEGYSAYRSDIFDTDDPVFSRWSRNMERLKHKRFRTVHRCFLDYRNEKFGMMFAAIPHSFHGGKNIVTLPDVFQKTVCPDSCEALDAFLVIDMHVQYSPNISVPLYIQALDYLISEHWVPQGCRRVLYKSRQFEESEELGQGLRFLEQKYASVLALEPLPDDCFFENVIYSCDVPVYFVQSSVGFYAKAMKKETYTLFNICNSFDPQWAGEFYSSSRNYVVQKTGIAKLPCPETFANRMSVFKGELSEIKVMLR